MLLASYRVIKRGKPFFYSVCSRKNAVGRKCHAGISWLPAGAGVLSFIRLKVYKSIAQKRPQDLAFNGTIGITAKEYALHKINVSASANINFVESIRLEQESVMVGEQAWMLSKTAVTIKIIGLSKSRPGI